MPAAIPVVAAARELGAGETLRREDLLLRPIPEQFTVGAAFKDAREVEGKSLGLAVSKGNPIFPVYFDGRRACRP